MIRALVDAGLNLQVVYGPMASEWAGHDAELGRDQPWDIPLLEWYAPTTFYFQDWILDNGLLTSTKRLEVTIVK